MRFNNNLGGWVNWKGSFTKKVEVIDKNQYALELENTNKVTVFINGGLLYYGDTLTENARKYNLKHVQSPITVTCDFLGNFIAKGIVSMLKIKTGWFSSIQVSHDALVCLDDLNIPLNSKSDWEKALARKQEVKNHKKKLIKQEKEENRKAILEENERLADEKEQYEKEMLEQKEQYEKEMLELKEHYIDIWGKTDGLKVWDGEIWQGMTKEMLISSRGKPGDIDETVYKTKTKAYYFYKSYITRQHKTRYRFRVDLEDDIVVGWKDLD